MRRKFSHSNTAVRFLIALGVSGCLITKGTDLSAGRQVGLAACLAGVLLQRGDYSGRMFANLPEMNMVVVLFIVLALGACIGTINGLIISRLNVPPFIATLGTQTIVYGTALVFTNAQPIGGFQKAYTQFVNGKLFAFGDFPGIPYLFLFIPNTYEVYWSISAKDFIARMQKEHKAYWNEERMNKAVAIGLTPIEVATLASIVEPTSKAPPPRATRAFPREATRI